MLLSHPDPQRQLGNLLAPWSSVNEKMGHPGRTWTWSVFRTTSLPLCDNLHPGWRPDSWAPEMSWYINTKHCPRNSNCSSHLPPAELGHSNTEWLFNVVHTLLLLSANMIMYYLAGDFFSHLFSPRSSQNCYSQLGRGWECPFLLTFGPVRCQNSMIFKVSTFVAAFCFLRKSGGICSQNLIFSKSTPWVKNCQTQTKSGVSANIWKVGAG